MISTIVDSDLDEKAIAATDIFHTDSIDAEAAVSQPISDKEYHDPWGWPMEYHYSYQYGLVKCYRIDESDIIKVITDNPE